MKSIEFIFFTFKSKISLIILLLINDKKINEVLNLKLKEIKSIDFVNNKIIARLENGKIGIF